MYCKRCNNEVDHYDKFCSNCGNDLRLQKEHEEDPKYNGKMDSYEYRYKAVNEFSYEQLLEFKKCKKCQWYNHTRDLPCKDFKSPNNCFKEYNKYHTTLLRCHSLYLFFISFLIVVLIIGFENLSIYNIIPGIIIFFILYFLAIHSTHFFETLSELFNDSSTIIHYLFYFLALFFLFMIFSSLPK